MSEPQTFTRTKDEAIEAVSRWMRVNLGEALRTDPDWYHVRLGLLIDCITDLHAPTVRAVPDGVAA